MSSVLSRAKLRKMALDSWGSTLDNLNERVDVYIDHANKIHNHFIVSDPSSASLAVEGEDSDAGVTVEEGLLQLDSKLASLVELENKLKATRVRLQGLRNTSTTLAPINRLPTEILSLVITLGDRDSKIKIENRQAEEQEYGDEDFDDDELETEAPDEDHFPTVFSHVCRQWRQIALNTAKVWTHIDFSEGPPYGRAAEWLARSKQSELSLQLDYMVGDVYDAENLDSVLEIIGPNAMRAKSLVLRTSSLDELLRVVKHFTGFPRFPPLKDLTLYVEDTEGDLVVIEGLPERLPLLRTLMKQLQHVDFDRVYLPWGSPAYKGLKSLRLANLSLFNEPGDLPRDLDLYIIFQECPELERLELDSVWLRPEDDEDTYGTVRSPDLPVVTFPKLKKLSLAVLSHSVACFVLSVLSAPFLERFAFEDYATDQTLSTRESAEFNKVLLAFLSTLQPSSLKYLRITGTPPNLTDVHVKQMLVRAPELEELTVDNSDAFNDEVIRSMQPPIHLIPKIKTLRMLNCSGVSAAVLKGLIEARNGAERKQPIEKLVAKYCEVEGADSALADYLAEKVNKVVWDLGDSSSEGSDDEAGDDEI